MGNQTILGLRSELNQRKFNWEKVISEYINFGGHCLSNWKELQLSNDDGIINSSSFHPSALLVLRYEHFFVDIAPAISQIEVFVGCTIEPERKSAIAEKLSASAVENYIEKTFTTPKPDPFTQVDGRTGLHGNHISVFKGETDYTNLLTNETVSRLLKNSNVKRMVTLFQYHTNDYGGN